MSTTIGIGFQDMGGGEFLEEIEIIAGRYGYGIEKTRIMRKVIREAVYLSCAVLWNGTHCCC